MNWKTTLLICIVILLAAGAAIYAIFSTEPVAEREGATKKSAMLVETVEVARGSYRPTVVAMGKVRAEKEILLRTRVDGEVIELAPSLTPGGHVDKDTVLLRLDPADYNNRLAQRRSELQEAQALLALERGRQDVARQDYELLDAEVAGETRALILRKPQLDTALAGVEAARAAVRQAELELDRTTITAPFNAHVLSREVNIGSQVKSGDPLARLAGIDTYWVEATVPIRKLHSLEIPTTGKKSGAPVRIFHHGVWPDGVHRRGWVSGLIGVLEEETRLARLLISVDDPLALEVDSEDRPKLILGSFVEARIEAEEIADVIRLDRDHLRQGKTVWLMKDEKLRIRPVDIAFEDAQYAYVSEGLSDGDRVVISDLATVTEGASLRVKEESLESR